MEESTSTSKSEPGVAGQMKAVQLVANLNIRHRNKQKKKLTKFERRYTALGPQLNPEHKRIDYLLVHKLKSSDKAKFKVKEDMRTKFENGLRAEGFQLKTVVIDDLVYIMLHCPFKRLCKEAESVKLQMPLKGGEKDPTQRTTWFTAFMDRYLEQDSEVDYISAPFKMDCIDMFEGYEAPTFFFRPSQRSLLTHHILINLDIKDQQKPKDGPNPKILQKKGGVEDCMADFCMCCLRMCGSTEEDKEDLVLSKMGLPYLLMKEVYDDAYVLHEDSEASMTNESHPKKKVLGDGRTVDMHMEDLMKNKVFVKDPRRDLNNTWPKLYKFQPLWKIRNYFGEKIALYFAWVGLLIASLWIPMFIGIGCFFYGLTISIDRADNQEAMPTNLTQQEQIKWQMGQIYDMLRGSFDNDCMPFFALIICVWGTLFLELWKRHQNRLAYEWDSNQFEQDEPDRPQFFGTKVKKDPITQEDNWFYPFKRQVLKFCLSASALIFMICLVFISLAAVVVYRVIISVDYCTYLSAIECLTVTSIVSALLNAVSILLLGRVYDMFAVKLTDWENHRTQTQYDDALIIKLFAFQFANSYSSCFYIAFFRGRFDAFGVFGLGAQYSDTCEGDNCMSHLSFQVLILMLAKPFPKFFKDIVLPFVMHLYKHRPAFCHSQCCENKVKDEEKSTAETNMSSMKAKQHYFTDKERTKPELGDFTLSEYTEKVIIYGFLMLFASSFPLAPVIALVSLLIDRYVDAKRLLWLNRRPIAFIAQDIGMWYGILNFVNLIGVVSNGFLIAFSSSWGQKYSTVNQLIICLAFEHIVFSAKFILAYLIPDVPKDVSIAIRREKYQVTKKFEKVARPIDYSKLIPSTKQTDKVRPDSFNYGGFDEEDLVYDDDDDATTTKNANLPRVDKQREDSSSGTAHVHNSCSACGHGIVRQQANAFRQNTQLLSQISPPVASISQLVSQNNQLNLQTSQLNLQNSQLSPQYSQLSPQNSLSSSQISPLILQNIQLSPQNTPMVPQTSQQVIRAPTDENTYLDSRRRNVLPTKDNDLVNNTSKNAQETSLRDIDPEGSMLQSTPTSPHTPGSSTTNTARTPRKPRGFNPERSKSVLEDGGKAPWSRARTESEQSKGGGARARTASEQSKEEDDMTRVRAFREKSKDDTETLVDAMETGYPEDTTDSDTSNLPMQVTSGHGGPVHDILKEKVDYKDVDPYTVVSKQDMLSTDDEETKC